MFVKITGVKTSEAALFIARESDRMDFHIAGLTIQQEGHGFRGFFSITVTTYRNGAKHEITNEPKRTSLYNTEDDVQLAAQLMLERRKQG